MSKHEELIERLRESSEIGLDPEDAYAAADALEAQAREIEGLRKDAERYRRLRWNESVDDLIRSDCRGLYLPQRDALDSAVDTLLFTTPAQRGEIAGDGNPCNNDHDPDCRWPDCRCRERERMTAAIDAPKVDGHG